MSGSHLIALLGSVAIVLYFVVTPLLIRRSASKLLPGAIAARLQSPDDLVSRRVRVMTWDPGSPLGQRSGWLYGKGRATYRMGEDGQVHLRFERSDGKVIERVGPVPPQTEVPHHRRALYGPLTIMAGSAVLGGVVGLLIATQRLVGAAWGLLVGIGVGWVAATVTVAARRMRRAD